MRGITTTLGAGAALAVAAAMPALAADERQLVAMPAPMQEHMLGNMRDHLRALEDIMAAVAAGNAKQAADIAERRIGMSSLTMHGAGHMAPFMPEGMQRIGTDLHHVASRFAVAVRDAELEPGEKSTQAVFKALADVTANCNACHAAYRIR